MTVPPVTSDNGVSGLLTQFTGTDDGEAILFYDFIIPSADGHNIYQIMCGVTENASDIKGYVDGYVQLLKSLRYTPEAIAAAETTEAAAEESESAVSSSSNPASLLNDYLDYLDKYTKVMSDFDAWNSQDMNKAEMSYYLEVQNRVSKKLLEVGY